MTVDTVVYAAPEQLMGEEIDGRADQYALAATAYHLLTGSQLYPYSTPQSSLAATSTHRCLPSRIHDPNSPRSTQFWLPRWPRILPTASRAAWTSPAPSPKPLLRKACELSQRRPPPLQQPARQPLHRRPPTPIVELYSETPAANGGSSPAPPQRCCSCSLQSRCCGAPGSTNSPVPPRLVEQPTDHHPHH